MDRWNLNRAGVSGKFIAVLVMLIMVASSNAGTPCRIQVIDAKNGWPVPLVELRTTHHVRLVSDNAGMIAMDLPELMGVATWFTVEGHGYSVPKDGFGYRGVRLTPRPGATLTVEVQRKLPAKRLGRITGGGLFAESQKLGDHLDWKEQGVLGCDSVQNAVHQGKLFWSWGDTVLPHYPLGRFHMIGATTDIQPLPSLQPPVKLRYNYFTDNKQVVRNIAEMPGKGPTWLGGFASVPDADGAQRLVATYSKIKPPLTEYERGLCVWNEADERFDRYKVLDRLGDERPDGTTKVETAPSGHPVKWTDDRGKQWLLFGDPFPILKCPATFEGWGNPALWQRISPQKSVPVLPTSEAGPDPQAKQVVKPHRGAIAWNAYRQKWVTVFTELYGESSSLGELWYAEAEAPTGPWSGAIHVVTHNNYSFYNPQLHPEFTPVGSPILLFEATYTHTFSKSKEPTPRHNYNQVLYRLDLNQISNPNEK